MWDWKGKKGTLSHIWPILTKCYIHHMMTVLWMMSNRFVCILVLSAKFNSFSALLRLYIICFSVVSKGRDVRVNIFDMAGHPVFYEVQFPVRLDAI